MVGLDNPLHIAIVLLVVLLVFGAKRRDRRRIRAAHPVRLICFHAPEKIANGLADSVHNVWAGSRWGNRFGPQEILAAFQTRATRQDSHPRFGTRAHGLFTPHILLQALARQAAGKSPFLGIKFANALAENSAAHGIKQIARQQSLKSAAYI